MDHATYTHIITHLAHTYGGLYQRGGVTYPFQLTPANGTALDTLLGPPPTERVDREALAFYDERVLAAVRAAGGTLYDGRTYAFARLERNPLRLHARLGTYFDHMATCIALERELTAGGETPLREALGAALPSTDTALNGAGRSAAIGVNTLVVFRSGDGYRALLARRSGKTAHAPGALHVLPAFTFQPTGADTSADWDLRAGILREYLEELFGVAEAEHGGADTTAHPARTYLEAALADGRAELTLTGLTCNMITTHVSVCTLLLLHDPDWYDQYRQAAAAVWEIDRQYLLPIDTDAALLAALPPEAHLITAPNGASALWLGVDAARRRLGY